VRHAIATVFKATVSKDARVLTELSERCGWQGLFAFNQISELALTFQGNSIAEGDVLVLCIRLASELLGSKYALPQPRFPLSKLALHETGLFAEAERLVNEFGGYQAHRGEAFNAQVLPRTRTLIEAIGCRMAYEAAEAYHVHPAVVRLYEHISMGEDLSWYVENGHTERSVFFDSLAASYEAATPALLLRQEDMKTGPYITAPIMSHASWDVFLDRLPQWKVGPCTQSVRPKL
ncbi:hypothetical protein K4F52_010373, partial [Lecanicillium sp. MT-2017a]